MVMKTTIALVFLMQFAMMPAHAQESELRVTPKTCVALKKGQVCYQSIRIRFSTSTDDDFCLMSSEATEPLQCWSNENDIELVYGFASGKDIEFTMVNKYEQAIAKARVTLVWVYKQSRKKNRWRLF